MLALGCSCTFLVTTLKGSAPTLWLVPPEYAVAALPLEGWFEGRFDLLVLLPAT